VNVSVVLSHCGRHVVVTGQEYWGLLDVIWAVTCVMLAVLTFDWMVFWRVVVMAVRSCPARDVVRLAG